MPPIPGPWPSPYSLLFPPEDQLDMRTFPDFAWAVGEESSDPIVSRGGQSHRVDQLAQSCHLDQLESDLQSIADLGVPLVRYGMPWRLSEPEPGRYDWTLWDRALGACQAAGLQPVVDLLHFGLPDHCAGFADPDWVGRFIDYAEAFLARYPAPRFFTPVNEPGLTAMMSGLAGVWNDRLRADGLPVRGLCWYSRGDHYDWQTMLIEPTGQVTEVGLFDAARRPRPVASQFASCVRQGPPAGSSGTLTGKG